MRRRDFLAISTAAAFAPSFARAAEAVALTMSGAMAFVPVSVAAAEPHLFLIDTGAAVTVVDPSVSTELGARWQANKAGPARASPTTISLAGFSRVLEPAVIDLGAIATVLNAPVKGLLGSDFLSGFRVRLDYGAKTLALDLPAPIRPPGAIALRFDDLPFIQASVRLDGKTLDGEFGVDTGLDSFVKLSAQRVAQVFPGLRTEPGEVVTMAGQKPQQIARFDALRIGGLDSVGVAANISADAPPRGAGPQFLGMIGAPAFANRILTLDVQGGWASCSPVVF